MILVEIRNPIDLTNTYTHIEIQSDDNAAFSSPTTLTSSLAIDTTTASDLSSGYTSYSDENGVAGTTYYRFRYKVGVAVSAWSDVFLAGATVLHTRFRNRMRDNKSGNYFFSQEEIDSFLQESIDELWPITWFETYEDGVFVPDSTTEIFTFPVQVTRLTELQLIDTDGTKLRNKLNWSVRGRKLLFDVAPRSGITIRAWVEKRFTKLAEVPEIWDSYLLNKMRMKAYETLEGDRHRFYKYNSIAKPEGGNLPSLDKVITRIEQQIQKRENQLRRSRRPADMRLV